MVEGSDVIRCNSLAKKIIFKQKHYDSRLLSFSVVRNTVCWCGGYKVNGVTGCEVGDVTGDDV